MANKFEVPDINAVCDVCGANFNRMYGYDVAGMFICIKCNRYRHMVHALRFVQFMAAKECQVRHWENDGITCWSNLDCGCDTCSARKVLRFNKAWHQRAPRRAS